jgi:hypothetical protein
MRGRAILIVASLVALGLLAAGCGGGKSRPGVAALGPAVTTTSSPTAASLGQNQSPVAAGSATAFVAFVDCMQKHGIQAQLGAAGKGGPGGTPLISIQGGPNGPDSSKFTAARNACRKLLPGGGPKPLTPAQMAQNTRELVRVAACMRTHGYPSFPDPSNEGVFNLTGSSGFDPNSPQFQSAMNACEPSGARLRIGFRVAGGAGHPCNAPLSRSESAMRFC